MWFLFFLIDWVLSRADQWTELINCNINEVHEGWDQTLSVQLSVPESSANILEMNRDGGYNIVIELMTSFQGLPA